MDIKDKNVVIGCSTCGVKLTETSMETWTRLSYIFEGVKCDACRGVVKKVPKPGTL
jgi:ferredoxin